MSGSDRHRNELFDLGVAAFNRRDFFEAHELWEEIWTPSKPPERAFLQALIHFAVGYHHHRRGNRTGALRQLDKGLRKSAAYPPTYSGVRLGALVEATRRDRAVIANGGAVETFPLIALVAMPGRQDNPQDTL